MPKKLFNEFIIQQIMAEWLFENKSMNGLGRKYGVSGHTIASYVEPVRHLRPIHISKTSYPHEIREQIRGEWLAEGKSCEELSQKYNVSDATIHRYVDDIKLLRPKNFKNKSTRVNEYVFHDIDEKGKYWVGFLMSDGCLFKENENKEYRIILGLHNKDAEEVENFKDWTGYTGAVSYRTDKRGVPSASIAISSDIMANKLMEYGLCERKSKTAKIKLIENSANFWKGMICGDGYIGIYNNSPQLELVGSFAICHQFKSFCKQHVKTNANVTRMKTIYRFRLTGMAAYEIIKILFGSFDYGLKRKVEKAKELVHNYAEKYVTAANL